MGGIVKYLYCDLNTIAVRIKNENRKVAIYGAGMIGNVFLPYFITEYQLYDNVLFYVDGDERKQGYTIRIGQKEYPIVAISKLRELPQTAVLLITNSNFMPVVQMLDEINELECIESYIVPIALVHNAHKKQQKSNILFDELPVIPKKIHYCWFSRKPVPDYLKKCIDSWYKYCPDYEIIRWDEDNYDVSKILYMKQAYEAKKWGFVPDIARLDILYEHGGIYLDTDVELIRNLDDLLYQSAFTGVEKWGNINMGGCSGTKKHHPVIKSMLDFRKKERFVLEDGSLNQMTCGFYETKPLIELGMKPDNTLQRIADMTIYPSDYFHPYDYMSGETHITDNTHSIHHFNGGWLNEDRRGEREKTTQMYREMLERMQSEEHGKQRK